MIFRNKILLCLIISIFIIGTSCACCTCKEIDNKSTGKKILDTVTIKVKKLSSSDSKIKEYVNTHYDHLVHCKLIDMSESKGYCILKYEISSISPNYKETDNKSTGKKVLGTVPIKVTNVSLGAQKIQNYIMKHYNFEVDYKLVGVNDFKGYRMLYYELTRG